MGKNMKKEEKILDYYVLCNRLKNIIRTGWKDWNVKRERIESVAEHIFGTQMLAISMQSEYNYDIDLKKVILMLSVHELEEIMIGDLTAFQISREEKAKLGHIAIKKVLENLTIGEDIEKLILEFDERKTMEAKFAYWCDKLECDLQCRLYDLENCVNLNDQPNNTAIHDGDVKNLLASGKSWSEMWLDFGQTRYNYDENFMSVSEYAKKNDITVNRK